MGAVQMSKREHFEQLLAWHGVVLVQVEVREDVMVPAHLRTLKTTPIAVSEFDEHAAYDDGFTARLTFRGRSCQVTVPWSAVWAIHDERGHGTVYQERPPKLADVIDIYEARRTVRRGVGAPGKRRRSLPGHLRLV